MWVCPLACAYAHSMTQAVAALHEQGVWRHVDLWGWYRFSLLRLVEFCRLVVGNIIQIRIAAGYVLLPPFSVFVFAALLLASVRASAVACLRLAPVFG